MYSQAIAGKCKDIIAAKPFDQLLFLNINDLSHTVSWVDDTLSDREFHRILSIRSMNGYRLAWARTQAPTAV